MPNPILDHLTEQDKGAAQNSVDDLLHDFYEKYSPKTPLTSDKLSTIKQTYGDDYNSLIKDLYSKYAPAKIPNDSMLNVIKQTYNIPTHDTQAVDQSQNQQQVPDPTDQQQGQSAEQAPDQSQELSAKIMRQTDALQKATLATFTKQPELFSKPENRDIYYNELLKHVSPDVVNSIRGDDVWKLGESGGGMSPAVTYRTNPITKREDIGDATTPSPAQQRFNESTVGNIKSGAQDLGSLGKYYDTHSDAQTALHAGLAVGKMLYGSTSLVFPEVAAATIGINETQSAIPKSNVVLSAPGAAIDQVYKLAGKETPEWLNDPKEAANFLWQAILFHHLVKDVRSIAGDGKLADINNASKEVSDKIKTLTPDETNNIYGETKANEQAYVEQKRIGGTTKDYTDWVAEQYAKQEAANKQDAANLSTALVRKTAPAHFNNLDQVSLSKPISELPVGISVNYQGNDGHIKKDPETSEVIFTDAKGKETVLAGGGTDQTAGDMGITINEGKYSDGRKYFVEKTADGNTVYRVNKDGTLKPMYEGENANVERRDAIISKALERTNAEASIYDLSKKAQAVSTDIENSQNPTVQNILKDKHDEIQSQLDALHQQLAEQNSMQAANRTALSIFESHKAEIEGSMADLSPESKALLTPELDKINEQIKKLKDHAIHIDAPNGSGGVVGQHGGLEPKGPTNVRAKTEQIENPSLFQPAPEEIGVGVGGDVKALSDTDRKTLEGNNFKDVDGMMMNTEGTRAWSKISDSTKALLKKYGIHYIEGIVNFDHLKGGETKHGNLVKLKNGEARGIQVNVSSVGDKFNIENTTLHELGHKVYEGLSTEQKKQLEREPITQHGKEVKKNVEDGGKTYKKEDIGEEDFAELFAEKKGDLKSVEQSLKETPKAEDAKKEQILRDQKNKEINDQQEELNRKLADDEAEAKLRAEKLIDKESPEQEPNVAGIEREGENPQGAGDKELVQALKKADNLIDDATGVSMTPISDIHTDEASFQNREKLDEGNIKNIVDNYSPSEFDPIVTFQKEDGKTYVLSGHHRFEAAKQLGLKKIKTTPLTYPAGHEHAGKIVPPSDIAYASKWSKEEANINRKSEDLLERAKIYRKQREDGIKESQIEKNTQKERGNQKFVYRSSALNPKGKTISAINQVANAQDPVTQREAIKIASWIGQARIDFPALTDAHENELYDYLMGDPNVKSMAIFLDKIQQKSFGLQDGEPLNIKQLDNAGKSQNRIDWEKKRDELRAQASELNASIKTNKETGWNKIKSDMIAAMSKGSDADAINAAEEKFNLPENQKIYEKKIDDAKAQLKKAQDDLAKHLLKENDLIAGDKAQIGLFEEPKDAKEIADKIREGKIGDDIAMGSVPFFKQVWNAALEALAKIIEVGGKFIDAVKKGIDYIKDSEWYKSLSKEDKVAAEKTFTDHADKIEPEVENKRASEINNPNKGVEDDQTLFPLPPTANTSAKIGSKISNVSPNTAASILRKSTILTEKSLAYKARWTLQNFYQSYIKHIEDISGNAKEALKNAGGAETVMLKDISNKSSGKASLKIKENDNKIFKGLDKDQMRSLGEIIEAKRAIQLDAIYDKRGVNRLKHQSGFTSEFYQNALDGMKQENPSQFADLEKRADDYFAAQKELLDLKKKNGLLNQEGYDKLLEQSMYSPRVFIQHLDELGTKINKGRKISVNDADIRRLDEGSEGLMVKDPRLLLGMSTSKTYSIIAKNDAAKSLYEFAKANPKNGVAEVREIVKTTKDGKPVYADLPADKDVVSAMVGGERKDIVVSKEFADEWVSSDPAISAALGEAVQWLTGSTLLRYAATGVNPLFALANTPRDMAYVYFTTGTYSPHIPVFIKQIHQDMAAVAKDVFARKGRYKDFIDEGGSIELLTHQGRFYTGSAENEGINRISHVLGYVGETSELLTRIAMRERGIKNGTEQFVKDNKRDPNAEELKQIKIKATYDAINQLDFSQGGDWTKALNKFVPYTNAAFQATRGLARAARRNPKQFLYKAAQLAAIAGALVVYNLSQEGYDQVSDDEKARNYIIMLGGMYKTDAEGNKQHLYVKIPKSQEAYFFSSLAEQSVEFALTGKKPGRQSWLAAKMQAPPIPFVTQNPPLLEAVNAYQSNYDTYFDKKLWYGSDAIPNELQFYKNTPEAYKKIGEVTGLSPEKLRGSVQKVIPGIEKNPYITIPIKAFGIAAEEMGLKERTNLNKTFSQNMEDVLGGLYKKYVGETMSQDKNNLFKLREITSPKYMLQMDKSIQELRKNGNNDRADEAIREHDAQVEELTKSISPKDQQPSNSSESKTESQSHERKHGSRK